MILLINEDIDCNGRSRTANTYVRDESFFNAEFAETAKKYKNKGKTQQQ